MLSGKVFLNLWHILLLKRISMKHTKQEIAILVWRNPNG